ncbi:hypothetical protein [Streptomyces sp. G-5]|uniref:hypothetical protein n=1 Tax=Streptomyces sp. G-5 TaxID=2977231 RepID=UPI0021D03831|nr:hypothetical protein [Streptomyces sp. G-5]MCU4750266.1 hypothetical protein [Streptomyces sp. G-5]
MMDSCSSLDLGEGTVLKPIFDPRLRTFTIFVRTNGGPTNGGRDAIHTLTRMQPGAWAVQDLIEEMGTWLAEQGVRQLTQQEEAFLYSGPLAASAAEEPPFESAEAVHEEAESPDFDPTDNDDRLFMDLSRLVLDKGVELRPVFSGDTRTFSVQLWTGGEQSGIHSLNRPSALHVHRDAHDLIDEVGPFLDKHGLRRLTNREESHLWSGLLAAQAANEPPFEPFAPAETEEAEEEPEAPDFGPIDLGDGAVLKPIFDPRLRTFSVQLWSDGQPDGIHGLVEDFRHADQAVEAIGPFLEEHGVRQLTEKELAFLYAGLIQAKGGPDFELLLMQLRHPAVFIQF